MSRQIYFAKTAGVTLIELIVTIAIMGIALGIGMPAISNMASDNSLSTTYNQTVSLTAYARSQANKRNSQSITLCKSTDSQNCSNATAGFKLIVFVDGNTMGQVDGDDILLKEFPIDNTRIKLKFNQFDNNRIVFLSSGKPQSTGNIMICDARNAPVHGIIMNISGQVRKATAGESSCG